MEKLIDDGILSNKGESLSIGDVATLITLCVYIRNVVLSGGMKEEMAKLDGDKEFNIDRWITDVCRIETKLTSFVIGSLDKIDSKLGSQFKESLGQAEMFNKANNS